VPVTIGSIEVVVRALNENDVRYLIVGGLAVVAHGYVRFTADVDLLLDLDEPNLRRATAALRILGYQPRAPVPLDDFISSGHRATWRREKHMTVFSLYSHQHAATEIDLFIEMPFDFSAAYARAARLEVAPGVIATFAGLDDLLVLKRLAARPQDAIDIQKLEALRRTDDDEP
jgi:hypothetical protein